MPENSYKLVCVDRLGVELGEFDDAQLDHVTWDLNGPGEIAYVLPQTSDNILIPQENINEIQFWANKKLLHWGFHNKTAEGPVSCSFTCPGLLGYGSYRFVTNTGFYFGYNTDHSPQENGIEQLQIAADLWTAKMGGWNIGVGNWVASGVERFREYDIFAHQNLLDDMLSEFPTVADADGNLTGFDYDITWAPDGSQRYFQTYYPMRGALKPAMLFEWGVNIVDYANAKDGSRMANLAYVTGGSNGDIKFENHSQAEAANLKLYGTWEGITSQSEENDIHTLLELSQRWVASHKKPLQMPEITVVESTDMPLLGVLFPGDIVPIKIFNGRTQINGQYRIQTITWNPGAGNFKITLIDPSEVAPPTVPGTFRAIPLGFKISDWGALKINQL